VSQVEAVIDPPSALVFVPTVQQLPSPGLLGAASKKHTYFGKTTPISPAMSEPPKRGPGRPKGSKNPLGTKNVGRPCKNGEPPWPRTNQTGESRIPNLSWSRHDPHSLPQVLDSSFVRSSISTLRPSSSGGGSKTPVAIACESPARSFS
jgi:hypothetical protein